MNLNQYEEQTAKFFGETVFRDLRQLKLHSIYRPQSKYFQRCFEALLEVEDQFIQDLIFNIKEQRVEGAFAEFGIFQGAWIERFYQITERIGLSDRDIYGFDSFQGLSAPHSEYDGPFWKEGMYAASREEVEERLDILKRPRIKLIEGFFEQSLKTAEAQKVKSIAFSRIDCDIYEPAKECLEFLSNRLAHNSVLVFDDWPHSFEIGEGRAFAEWVPTVPHLGFEFIFMGPWDHLHLRVTHRNRPK